MSMLSQNLQWNDFNRAALRGVQQNRRSHSILVRLLPAGRTNTPVISRLKTRKTKLRHRGAQIIALSLAVAEKAFGHHATDAVTSKIAHIGSTMSISEPTSHGLTTAHFQRLTQNIQITGLDFGFGKWFRAHCAMESMRSLPKDWHIARQDG